MAPHPLFKIRVIDDEKALSTGFIYLILPEVFEMRVRNPEKGLMQCYHELAYTLRFASHQDESELRRFYGNYYALFVKYSKLLNEEMFMMVLRNAVRRTYIYEKALTKLYEKRRYRDMIFYLGGENIDFIVNEI